MGAVLCNNLGVDELSSHFCHYHPSHTLLLCLLFCHVPPICHTPSPISHPPICHAPICHSYVPSVIPFVTLLMCPLPICHTLPPHTLPSVFSHSSVQYASHEGSVPHTKEPTPKTQAAKEMVSDCVPAPPT